MNVIVILAFAFACVLFARNIMQRVQESRDEQAAKDFLSADPHGVMFHHQPPCPVEVDSYDRQGRLIGWTCHTSATEGGQWYRCTSDGGIEIRCALVGDPRW